jgi:hypothetical protein
MTSLCNAIVECLRCDYLIFVLTYSCIKLTRYVMMVMVIEVFKSTS